MARYFSPPDGVGILCSACGCQYRGITERDPCPRCGGHAKLLVADGQLCEWCGLPSCDCAKSLVMINRHIPIESANIKAIGYSPEQNILEVIFAADPSEVYRYKNVTPLQYAQLMNAKSHGQHFAQTIRKDAKAWPWEKAKLPTRK